MADQSNNSLLDIANNGAALNQALSELITNVAKLSSITLPVANGGTGLTAPGASGNVLTSNGTAWVSSALPTPAANVSSITFGTTGLTPSTASTGAVSVAGTLNVANGGTGRSTLTQYALLAGGTTATGNLQSLGTGSSGQVLTSAGSSAVPVFQMLTQSQLSSAFNASGSAPFYACRAWVIFNGTGSTGTNQTLRGSGNITTVYKNGTGDYTLTFTTAMPDANYAVTGLGYAGAADTTTLRGIELIDIPTASSFRIRTINGINTASYDGAYISVAIFK